MSNGQRTFKAMQTFYKKENNDSTLTAASTDLAMNARRAKQQKVEIIPFATIVKEKWILAFKRLVFQLLYWASILSLICLLMDNIKSQQL